MELNDLVNAALEGVPEALKEIAKTNMLKGWSWLKALVWRKNTSGEDSKASERAPLSVVVVDSAVQRMSRRAIDATRALRSCVHDYEPPAPAILERMGRELEPAMEEFRAHLQAEGRAYFSAPTERSLEACWRALFTCAWALHDYLCYQAADPDTRESMVPQEERPIGLIETAEAIVQTAQDCMRADLSIARVDA